MGMGRTTGRFPGFVASRLSPAPRGLHRMRLRSFGIVSEGAASQQPMLAAKRLALNCTAGPEPVPESE